MRRLGGVFLRSLIMFGLLEGVLWTLAALGVITLPSVILDNFDRLVIAARAGRQPLYEPDPWTLTRMRRNVDITYPRYPSFSVGPRTYRVQTNSEGMRDREIAREKPAGVIRVACLGDSVTFGFNVEGEEAYPQQLQALLDARYPGKFQVMNFGVPGFASLQGIELLKHRVLAFQPDVVTLAFGTNDRFWYGPEKISRRLRLSQSWLGRMSAELVKVFNYSATYRGLRVLFVRLGTLLRPGAQFAEVFVGLDEMANAIVEAQSLGERAGFSLVVLNNDLQETDAVEGLTEGAVRAHVPLLDMAGLFRQRRGERDLAIAAQRGLTATTLPDATHKFVLRVVVEGHPNSVLVRHVRFPSLDKPVTEPLYDDGTHGDEHAGDGVWSLATKYPPGMKVHYLYFSAPSAAAAPVREFQDAYLINGVPAFGPAERALLLKVGAPDIDVYGTTYLHADASHPNAQGQRLIAEQLESAILALPKVRQALGQV